MPLQNGTPAPQQGLPSPASSLKHAVRVPCALRSLDGDAVALGQLVPPLQDFRLDLVVAHGEELRWAGG